MLANINISSVYSANTSLTSNTILPLQLVGQLLVSFDLPHGLGGVVRPGMVLTLVVNEHPDELIIHDLHVDLVIQSDGDKNSSMAILLTWPS